MRKIKVDQVFSDKVKDFNKQLFKNLNKLPAKNLEALRTSKGLKKKYKMPADIIVKYIKHIESEYKRILAADDKEMKVLINEFATILNGTVISTAFHEAVADALRYDAIRSTEYPEFIRTHNVKTCCYCHSQSTIVFTKLKDGSAKAFFELDHKFPKSKYPFLATSFYNLYPICGNCNRAKGNKPSDFELYTETDNLDLLNFGIEDISVAKYWKKNDPSKLVITVTPVPGQEALCDNYLPMFLIKEIYNMQLDVAEELVVKTRIYNDEYKEVLVKNFKSLFSDTSMINRLIIGNYDRPEEMLMRPTAKFVQEVARDVGLIPKLVKK